MRKPRIRGQERFGRLHGLALRFQVHFDIGVGRGEVAHALQCQSPTRVVAAGKLEDRSAWCAAEGGGAGRDERRECRPPRAADWNALAASAELASAVVNRHDGARHGRCRSSRRRRTRQFGRCNRHVTRFPHAEDCHAAWRARNSRPLTTPKQRLAPYVLAMLTDSASTLHVLLGPWIRPATGIRLPIPRQARDRIPH